MKDLKKILIVRLGGVGDVVCTLPALDALRAAYPEAAIGYAVEERAFQLVNGHPALDRVHLFPRWRIVKQARDPLQWPAAVAEALEYARGVRGERYDIALDFQRNFKGAMHAVLSGAPRRMGFTPPTAREFSAWFSRERVAVPPGLHWVEKFLVLVGALGAHKEDARYRLPDAPDSRARVNSFLSENGLNDFIVIHPTASPFDPQRRWEPERFGAVARLLGEKKGLRCVITWGPKEKATAERVVAASGGQAELCFETRSLLDVAELDRKARLYVGCDTGPMHIASAVGLPSVVLFGSGDPVAYGPRSPGSRIVSKRAQGRLLPLSRTSPEDVFQVCTEVLAASANGVPKD